MNKESVLNEIIGSKEASEMLNISQGYLRQLVLKGKEFEGWEYKKVGNATIFLKDSIASRKGKFKEYKKDEPYTPYEEIYRLIHE